MPFGTIAVLPFRNPSRLSVLPRMVIRQGAKLNEKKKVFRENFFETLVVPREVVLFFGHFGKCC